MTAASRRILWRGLLIAAALLIALCLSRGALGETRQVPLYDGEAPLEGLSEDGAQPGLTAYEAEGAEIAVVICPGGSYSMLSTKENDVLAKRLRRSGISGFVLSYRLAPCNCMAPLTDAQRAIRVVRGMGYRYVGVLGFSAGGHLACCAATHWDAGDPGAADPLERLSCRPDFLASCYAVVSFERFPEQASVANLLAEHAGDSGLLSYFSADQYVTAQTPPAYIMHSCDDQRVSVEHSMLLASAYSRARVYYEMHVYPGSRHASGLAKAYPAVDGWVKECIDFIKGVCADEE